MSDLANTSVSRPQQSPWVGKTWAFGFAAVAIVAGSAGAFFNWGMDPPAQIPLSILLVAATLMPVVLGVSGNSGSAL